MSERDELAAQLADKIPDDIYSCVRVWEAWGFGPMRQEDFTPVVQDADVMAELADALIEAGYRKPRIITTVEELEALKPDAVVRSFMEVIYERTFSFRTPNKPYWQSPGNELPTASSRISLPATVLYEPTP
ncbi:hypothetical protein [Pseudarthrobacter sp. PS3-L1]|uniref:hypothetical protein n=1 Tax=Pseudarthrobacter sp. PS3-L1 TaxID=3046207 RepID=UPI0024B905DE|nr:hypothetical protein [Pseudarthrobacter sp. PS3-L1]MDJ0322137.1 hypothetical protein [Pseudarthrobacter sp. PS3-L1]